jgi:hypothetical protein
VRSEALLHEDLQFRRQLLSLLDALAKYHAGLALSQSARIGERDDGRLEYRGVLL